MLNRVKFFNAIISFYAGWAACRFFRVAFLFGGLDDKDAFTASQNVSKRLKIFTDAWINLNQTSIPLNRGILRLQMNESSLKSIVNEGNKLLSQSREDYALYISMTASRRINLQTIAALEKNHLAYSDVLDKALSLTMQRKLDDIRRLNIQKYQISMQSSYADWHLSLGDVTDRG